MVQAVFYHKIGSIYDDVTGLRYHFPKMYLSRVRQTVGDWVIYYGPLPRLPGRYYSGIAKVKAIEADPGRPDHYYAYLQEYLDFDRLVEYRENGGFENQLVGPGGAINPGRSVQAVRLITLSEFSAIVAAGLSEPDEWPNRVDSPAISAVSEMPQTDYDADDFRRPILQHTFNRPFRDAKFRQHIRQIYDRTCAFTGLRLINGNGRPEVEAAHIIPVERGGNDSIQNGIALSGTVHWMFDRGLLSMTDDFRILISRQLNEDVSHLLNRSLVAKVPEESRHRPHSHYIAWHREHVFKH